MKTEYWILIVMGWCAISFMVAFAVSAWTKMGEDIDPYDWNRPEPMTEQLAHIILTKNFTENRGFITLKSNVLCEEIGEREWEAVEHLCDEWDYCFGEEK